MEAIAGQQAFDIEGMIRQARLDEDGDWTGAPLYYAQQYQTPKQWAAAVDRYQLEHGDLGARPASHLWYPAPAGPGPQDVLGHQLHLLSADLRPGTDQAGPGALLYQANCPTCRWHSIHDSENAAVEAWHDHAMPGWRELPVAPTGSRGFHAGPWVTGAYPAAWQFPGSPIRTPRGPYATRHVPGRSPLGGYDLAAPHENHQED